MQIFAETDRLILREILPSDENRMFEMDNDPAVHIYLGNKPTQTIEEIREVIQFIRQQYIDNGIGRWAVVEKSSNQFIGWAGLKLIKTLTNGHSDFYDIGYRFLQSHWGKGYGTEAAKAALDYGFEQLHLNEIYGMTDADNKGSNNVLSKIGLTYIEDFDFEGMPSFWFKVTREEWLAKKLAETSLERLG